MFVCCICRDVLADLSQVEIHLATEHVFYSPYECENCKNARFPTGKHFCDKNLNYACLLLDHALRMHYEEDHSLQSYNVSKVGILINWKN